MSSHSSSLDTYAKKRDFRITSEPAPAIAQRQGPLLFVVHEHAARRLHYDLRLELDGVLKCWAIPHGLLVKPGEKHLAVPTEDHPLSYAPFEGVIPPKQYGAGQVIVWDCGLYAPDEGDTPFADRDHAQEAIRAGLANGKLSFTLAGTKLKGSYALVRTRQGWLILKHDDGIAAITTEAACSPLSGHTVETISATVARHTLTQMAPCGRTKPMPRQLAVMTAETAQAPFNRPDWMFEPKLDGYRITAFIDNGRVRLITRGGYDYADRFPEIVGQLRSQPVQPLVIDGEILAFKNGKPSFAALSPTGGRKETAQPCMTCSFYCFDILHAAGIDLRDAAYQKRRRFLRQCVVQDSTIQIVHAQRDGVALYKAALDTGLEGVVGKRITSTYQSGKRSADWVKVKPQQTAEFIVIGYINSTGGIGSLLLAYRDQTGVLQYAGRAGSGLNREVTAQLLAKLAGIRTDSPPASGISTRAIWVKPVLVVEVSYFEITENGKLRHPVFVRLRDDIAVSSVMQPGPALAAAATATDLSALEKDLDRLGTRGTISVDGHDVALSQLDKVLWPAYKRFRALTKRDLLRYLLRVSPRFLPVLHSRPLTLIRMPDGVTGQSFFQKHLDQRLPEFMETLADPAAGKEARKPLLLCSNLASLLWLGNLGTLEYHVWHSSFDRLDLSLLDKPDYLAFDLDPFVYSGKEGTGEEPLYNRKAFNLCVQVAFWLKEVLDALGLASFVKTTGKTGLHVFVPIERSIGFEESKRMCEMIGRYVQRYHPEEVTMDWSIARRTGKIFIDHNMNGRGRTLLAAWSPRAQPNATYSAPLSWEQLTGIDPVTLRLPAYGKAESPDAWQSLLDSRQSLDAFVGS